MTIVSVDGGCPGVENVKRGVIGATSQQYPLKMAEMGVAVGAEFIRSGRKPSGYTNTGVTLIAARAVPGVESADVETGMRNCFGDR